MTAMLIVADDLSGAAETAGAVTAVTSGVADLRLGLPIGAVGNSAVRVLDTDSRAMAPRLAGEATVRAVRSAPDSAIVYKKVDSLLRGNIASEVAALAAEGYGMVAVLAVPRIGRTVQHGIVHRDGSPVGSITGALGTPSVILPLEVVRSDGLGAAIRSAVERGAVPVLDSETDDDLHRIAEAITSSVTPSTVLLAAGGLARAMAALLEQPPAVRRFSPAADRVIVVAGTRSPEAARQVEVLVARGVRHVVARPGAAVVLDDHDAVVTLDASSTWQRSAQLDALAAVADAIAALPGRTDLVLTGGDTARRVLDGIGVIALQVEQEIEDGAVLSTRDSGAAVVTRPGSFGGDGSLARILTHLKGAPS